MKITTEIAGQKYEGELSLISELERVKHPVHIDFRPVPTYSKPAVKMWTREELQKEWAGFSYDLGFMGTKHLSKYLVISARSHFAPNLIREREREMGAKENELKWFVRLPDCCTDCRAPECVTMNFYYGGEAFYSEAGAEAYKSFMGEASLKLLYGIQ